MKLIQDAITGLKVADQKGRVLLGSRYAGKRFVIHEEADGTAILTPVLIVPEKDKPLTGRRLADQFAALETLPENWDGQNSPVPSATLIAYAREVVSLLHAGALARGLQWTEPHIGSNERGQILLEWWQGEHALTVFIRSEEQVDYLKSWGSDIESDMEDGTVDRIVDFVALSRWLYQQETQPV